MTAHGGHLYWNDFGEMIKRVSVQGGTAANLVLNPQCSGTCAVVGAPAADQSNVYWLGRNQNAPYNLGVVFRVPTTPGTTQPLLTFSFDDPYWPRPANGFGRGPHVDNGYLYWSVVSWEDGGSSVLMRMAK